jgi:alpha-tubulin suppressor-like RCC1 family protein
MSVFAAFRTTAVALGGYHTCAILAASGAISCWGRNTDGQAGQAPTNGGTTPGDYPLVPVPTAVPIGPAIAIAAGGYHSCALLGSKVSCWGLDNEAQLAGGTPRICGVNETCGTAVPTSVPGTIESIALAAGGYHTCALRSNGTVLCWGRPYEGQLGIGRNPTNTGPATVPGISNAVAITAGAYHTCALLAGGTVQCWGRNGNGQIGDGTTDTAWSPTTVRGLTGVKAIAAGTGGGVIGAAQLGGYHTCGLRSNGMVSCWGHNNDGELGNNSKQDASQPVFVSGISNATGIAAGGYHTCALLANGTIQCWGHNADGELGSGSTTEAMIPVTVAAGFTPVAIAAGAFHTCAVSSTGPPGLLQCWGNNGDSQLGSATASSRPVPVVGF